MIRDLNEPEITAAVLTGEHHLFLFGAMNRQLPVSGSANLDDGVAGDFRALSWPMPSGDGYWFVSSIRVEGLASVKSSRLEIVSNGDTIVMPKLSGVRTNPMHLVEAVKDEHPGLLGPVLDFACSVFGFGGDQPPARLLCDLGKEAAKHDGFAEIFGRFRGPGLMVQGWSRSLAAGDGAVIFDGERPAFSRSVFASFVRADLPPEASGVVGIATDFADDPSGVSRVYFRAEDGWRFLDVFESRLILLNGVVSSHLKDMLPSLGDVSAQRSIRRFAESQYEGVETVSRLTSPVRAAIDLSLRVPGKGIFVAGWLLDPLQRVDSVSVKGGGLAFRIDGDWARMTRRDVTDGFNADPLFAGRAGASGNDHGFMAFVPEHESVAPDAEFYMEIAVSDGSFGFLPLAPSVPTADTNRRLLGIVNVNDPEMDRVIARHIGPMLNASASLRIAPKAPCHPMGSGCDSPRVSVIIPVSDAREDVDLNIARLAIDPDFDNVEIVVAATATTHERLALNVKKAAEFYRVCVRFVQAKQALDAYDAIAAALPHARSDKILLLSLSVLPVGKGWLSALEKINFRSGRPAMVSPTLVYEDHSIRFAGIEDTVSQDGVRSYESKFVGYPIDWLREKDATTTDAVVMECVLMPRRSLAAALASAGAYVGPEAKGLDVCLRLKAMGYACVWVPFVSLVSLDESSAIHHEHWQVAGAMIDRWSFSDTWSATAA